VADHIYGDREAVEEFAVTVAGVGTLASNTRS
jgi:hypothetical protein